MAEAFGTGLGANVVSEILKSAFGTLKQQVLYVFKHRSYINDLNDQVQQLNQKRQRVEMGVDRARRQGDETYVDVGKWLKDVERFIEQEAKPITSNRGQAGTCSFITRYKVGRKAVKAAKAGSNLLGKEFTDVSYRPPLQRTKSMYVDRDYAAFECRESVFLKIMEALTNPSVNRIGVYGMGGVGKTTLVKKVAWQTKEDELFDDVAMAEVTEKPDYKRIQEKIANDLGLEFGQYENEFERADRIRNKLKKGKRVLVILDNIWHRPDLGAIGIPLGNDHDEGINDNQRLYKILVTSRRLDVLHNDMNTSENFCVNTLSDEDARTLFWKIVGNSTKKNDFCTVAEEIVGKCGGLPLAVATIANALKNKDLYAWEDALGKLNAANLRGIPKMDKNVFSIIELSFNLLDSDEAKSLFLLIGLDHASYGTSHVNLLRYGMGLGLFQDVYTLEQGRNRVYTLLNELKASCLLLEGDINTWVKMHEVIHAVAVSIASTNKLMFNVQDVPNLNKVLQEKIFKNPTAISLPYRDIGELPERLECPKLELFFLFDKSHSLTIPNNFFEGVKELKVIDFTYINLLSVPSSFGYLTNLRTLCLDECRLGDISIIGELTTLEILSFSGSNIERLPGKIGQLTRLQLLDLSECSSLKAIPAKVISRLSQLEELDLDNTFVQWEDGLNSGDGCNASLAELNQLSHLTTLRVCIPDAQIIPPSLFIQRLKRFKILIGAVWNRSYSMEASNTLKLKLNNISYLGYKLIKSLLKVTEDLFLDELKDVQNVLYELNEEGFLNLKYLNVQNGPELRYIVNSVGKTPFDAFLMLERLSLNNLVNLVKICDGPLKEASFNKLKAVKVNKCDELKYLFSISMAKWLSQLQEIEVTDCKNLQVIFAEDDKGHSHDESETDTKIAFPQLQSLTLQFLPQFTSFSFNMETALVSETKFIAEDDPEDFKTLFGKRIEFPSLEKLILSSINIEKISSVSTSCHSLKRLVVEGCSGLKLLFLSSMVKSLMQLQELKISKCELMEEVIDSKGLEGEEPISFPKLLDLWLEDLPKFTRFGIGNLVEFPSMNILEILNCPNLRTFFSNSTCEITSNKPEEMNSEQSIQPLFREKVSVPNLEKLEVYKMDTLRKIWDDQLTLNSFCKLKDLRIEDCCELKNIFPSVVLRRLQTLQSFIVTNCESLEEVFEVQVPGCERTEAIVVGQLREIHLSKLPKLKHAWNLNAKGILSFENLLSVKVEKCDNLKSLFPASIAKGLFQLKKLEIKSCKVEQIVAKEEVVVAEKEQISKTLFPKLDWLILKDLPKLKRFCYFTGDLVELFSLSTLAIDNCPNMEAFISNSICAGMIRNEPEEVNSEDSLRAHTVPLFDKKVSLPNLETLIVWKMNKLRKIWDDEQLNLDSFSKLRKMVVGHCNQLLHIFPSIMCGRLQRLEDLHVRDCDFLEEILELQALSGRDEIVFQELKHLGLVCLPRLGGFYLGNCTLKFPSLDNGTVVECSKMETFSRGILSTPKLQRLQLPMKDDKACREGDLNTTTQNVFKEMKGQTSKQD